MGVVDPLDLVPPWLLEPALEAARAALRELEDEDVPAGLRRVASYSGGRLPPPFARRLTEALHEDEWLREEAAGAWPETDPDSEDPATAASSLFLLRPEGWELRLGVLAGMTRLEAREEEADRLAREAVRLEEEVAESRRRVEEARRATRRVEEDAERRIKEARSDVREARLAGREEVDEARRRVAHLEGELEDVRTALEGEEERVAILREELLRARRAGDREPATEAGPGVWSARDGLELAEVLDDVAMAAGRLVGSPLEREGETGVAEPLRLPAGVRPDAPGGIDWLLRRPAPFTMVVDGYNAAFALDVSRDRLDRELARLRRRATARIRVVVVYDSSLPGGEEAEQGPGGVEVRFTEAGRTADEGVIELARGERTVVVSNDREVREGAEAAGALALWSDALVEWIRGR